MIVIDGNQKCSSLIIVKTECSGRFRRQTANEVATRLVAVGKAKPELLRTAVSEADPDLLRVALTYADPNLLEVALTKAKSDLLATALTRADGDLLRVMTWKHCLLMLLNTVSRSP